MFIYNNYIINIILFIQNNINILIYNSYNINQSKLMKIKKNEFDDWAKYIINKAEKDAYDAYNNILKYDDNIIFTDNLYIDRDYLLNNLNKYYIEPKFNLINKSKVYDKIVDIYYINFCNNIIYYHNNFDDIL